MKQPVAPAAPATTLTGDAMEVYSTVTKKEWLPVRAETSEDKDAKLLKQAKWEELLIDLLNAQNLLVIAGSGTSLGQSVNGPSMQSLYVAVGGVANCAEVVSEVQHDKNDENIENLLSRCKAILPFLGDAKKNTVGQFIKASEKLIADKCREFLRKADLSSHEVFLRRLGRRSTARPRLKLFTTNYDLCFEQASSNVQCPLVDGFSFSWPRRFSPRFFGYDFVRRLGDRSESPDYVEGVVQLYKLHGSVDWQMDGHEILRDPLTDTPCLVYPAATKFEQSFSQPYLEMMSQFIGSLREPNTTLLVIGFGFNDEHLAQPIASAIRSNAGLRVMLVDPSVKEKADSGKGKYHAELKAFIGENDERITLVNANFDAFTRSLPDLARPTMEERLALAVKRVTQGKS